MIDRRVQRTRRSLQQALIDLILQKGYDPITIKELTDRADVNYATFYLHYENKEQILDVTLREVSDDLVVELANDERCCIDSQHAMIRIFQHVEAHAHLYRVLFIGGSRVNIAITQTRNYIATLIHNQLMAILPEPDEGIPYEIIAQHTTGALLNVMSWWLENGMPFSPQIMGKMMCKLSSPATLIGLSLGFQLDADKPSTTNSHP